MTVAKNPPRPTKWGEGQPARRPVRRRPCEGGSLGEGGGEGFFASNGCSVQMRHLHPPPDQKPCFSRPDPGPVEPRFQRTEQFGFTLEGRRFVRAKQKLNPRHLPHHPPMPPRHPVRI